MKIITLKTFQKFVVMPLVIILLLANAWCYQAQLSLELDTAMNMHTLTGKVFDAEFNQDKMIEGDKKLLRLVITEFDGQLVGLAQKRSWVPLLAYYYVDSINRSIHDTLFTAGYLADKYGATSKPDIKD